MSRSRWALLLLFAATSTLVAQTAEQPFTRRNTFTVFGEYANDSSHIILGSTPNRKLGGAGVGYERRLVTRRAFTLSYDVEFRPLILNSDPAETSKDTITGGSPVTTTSSTFTSVVLKCVPASGTVTVNEPPPQGSYTINYSSTCGRQTTFAQALSPIGLRLSLRPRHALQVMFSSDGGYMFSTRPIPIPAAGSFNFTFNFGAGLEYFYAQHRSARLEYLVQHYSNHDTALENPGVDSGFVRLTFAFGR